ncbi:MAG: biotin transporter BioY [Alphaproteobacteria bacterium]|tara:strand:- start:374 stop:988 length:615 start_codon:yes stop_codon:yes gene_type:complete
MQNLLINNIVFLNRFDSILKNLLIILIGSILYALSARIAIPIPPVPVTLQTLVLLTFSMAVGSRLAFLTFALYIFQGIIGIPVFAKPPFSGFYYLIGPSGGYLLGMLIASYFVGYLAEKNYDKNFIKSLITIFIGTIIIFIPGLIWLGFWFDQYHPELSQQINLGEGYKYAYKYGLLVFKFTEPVKIALAACITPLIWHFVKKK